MFFPTWKIIQYGFPCSGSTVIWQILDYCLGGVPKAHSFVKYEKKLKVVATIRDFRDCLCTYLARRQEAITKENLVNAIEIYKTGPCHLESLAQNREAWANNKNILWLRYELFFNDFFYIFEKLEHFLNIRISEKQKEYCIRNFSLKSNKKKSQKLNLFKEVTEHIHGMHVTADGKIEKYKLLIPEQLQKLINEMLYDELKEWGYL